MYLRNLVTKYIVLELITLKANNKNGAKIYNMAEKCSGKIKKYGAPTDSPLVQPTSLVLVNFVAENILCGMKMH